MMSKQRWIIKVGSALLTNNGKGIDQELIANWAEQIVHLRDNNIDVIMVSSGAIVEGMKRLGWEKKPKDIHQLQAAAAVGQMGLVQSYEILFSKHDVHTAQILLTRDNLTNDDRYENISATLGNLLMLGVIPIVNENDTVSTAEIKFGDNDTLAALVANLVSADKLIILTDQNGVYDADPRSDKSAQLIHSIAVDDERLTEVASKSGGSLGSGGMYTKVTAAKQASESKTDTQIVYGREQNVLTRILHGEHVGTKIHC
ncbi:MAG TPA: glutamate 5-kinase [Candidatus Thioglobus sp.]|jgi:glutamate 5-kinase|nr:glutamate 5-kinase [Candidatus Thioglobus sp.]HIL42334.1 glutamate 5-kinase [Gammaproteobacteria bacterium]